MDKKDKNSNNKIAVFEKKQKGDIKTKKRLPKIEGVPYFVMERDVNGMSFNPKHLKKFSSKNKYTITVSTQKDGKTLLCNYFVDNQNILVFFKLYLDGKIEGEIIEIDKFNPEILA